MTTLRVSDVATTFRPSLDGSATFEHEGELLRALRGPSAQLLRAVLEGGAEDLFSSGLVRFQLSTKRLEGWDLVLAVERVPVVSYPPEWPTSYLKDAALLTLRLARTLAHRGLGLRDAHPWNVLFDGMRPVFVDIGSLVVGAQPSWAWLSELRAHLLLPLWLHSLGLHGRADAIGSQHQIVGDKRAWNARALRFTLPPALALSFARHRHSMVALTTALIEWVEQLQVGATQGAWSRYDRQQVEVGELGRYDAKMRAVDQVLRAAPPGQVLDLACNRGWYCRQAVSLGHRAVGIDLDDGALSGLVADARPLQLPILALRMNLLFPTGSGGLALAHQDAYTRLRSDTVLALAILHHLVERQGVTFELFASIVSRLARERVIVEFVPRDDEHLRRWRVRSEPSYTRDALVAAMQPYFPRWEITASWPAPRELLSFRRSN